MRQENQASYQVGGCERGQIFGFSGVKGMFGVPPIWVGLWVQQQASDFIVPFQSIYAEMDADRVRPPQVTDFTWDGGCPRTSANRCWRKGCICRRIPSNSLILHNPRVGAIFGLQTWVHPRSAPRQHGRRRHRAHAARRGRPLTRPLGRSRRSPSITVAFLI
jgi:hypothetical protein